jgi:hypothetical protein
MEDQSVSKAVAQMRERALAMRDGRAARETLVLPAELKAALGDATKVRPPSAVPSEVRAALGIRAEAGAADAFPGPETATACFEVHFGQYLIAIQVEVDLSTSTPYSVLEGSASGAILTSGPVVTPWQVTYGTFGFSEAPTYSDSDPPDDMLMIVEQASLTTEDDRADAADGSTGFFMIFAGYRPPLSYPGILIGGGSFTLYPQNTLFKGWQACS